MPGLLKTNSVSDLHSYRAISKQFENYGTFKRHIVLTTIAFFMKENGVIRKVCVVSKRDGHYFPFGLQISTICQCDQPQYEQYACDFKQFPALQNYVSFSF